MSEPAYYFVSYPGELTADDRVKLDRPGFKVYENGYGVSNAYWPGSASAPTEFTTYQVVRVTAGSEEDARAQVVVALGRAPEGMRVAPGRS